MRPISLAMPAIVVVAALAGCHGSRPLECQKLRQCCAAAQATGSDVETVRVSCTRKDDDDAVLCRRRLDDVVNAMPSLSDHEDCRMPAKP
ncbi:MAG: hypothetical protein HYV09_23085 [Deltaproteobacteria bacterium]|nr:hypothetical protein [Deltaproteobacteria bacterium]